jgi:hypothetical protein
VILRSETQGRSRHHVRRGKGEREKLGDYAMLTSVSCDRRLQHRHDMGMGE